MNLVQFIASRFGKVGVQSQYLDGELHLVDNTLTRPVTAAEKFQVLDTVVRSDAVDVVDGFAVEQVSAQVLGHDVTMFQDGVFFASDEGGHRQPHVSMPLGMRFVFAAFKSAKGVLPLVLAFASLIAKFLFDVKPATRFAPFGLFFAASKAREFVFLLGLFFAPFGGAWNRAVQWLSSKSLFVCSQVSCLHREFVAAFLASKEYRDFASGRLVLVESKIAATSKTAKSSVFAGVAVKRLLAFFTDSLDRHGYAPLFGNGGVVAVAFGIVK